MALGIRLPEYSELGVGGRKDTVYTFITTIHTAIVAPSHTFQLNNDQSNNVNNKYALTRSYRPVFVMTISVPIAENESHRPLLSNSASG